VALLSAIPESAAVDYELIPVNPLRGILRRRNFPTDALRPWDRRPAILEPDDFRRAVEVIADPCPRWMVLLAVFTGLRWGGLVAIRMEDEVDFRRNHLPEPCVGVVIRVLEEVLRLVDEACQLLLLLRPNERVVLEEAASHAVTSCQAAEQVKRRGSQRVHGHEIAVLEEQADRNPEMAFGGFQFRHGLV